MEAAAGGAGSGALEYSYRTPGEAGHPSSPANLADAVVFAVMQPLLRSKLNIVEIALKSKNVRTRSRN